MTASKLREVVRRAATVPERAEQEERCELCGEPIAPQHRHVLDLTNRELMCACRACSILFDSGAAGGGHYRLVPDRRLALADFRLDDVRWADLRIPVEMAFFFRNSEAGKVVAYYPSPAGPTESLLELDAWEELERANPQLRDLKPDVEALLVNRARGKRQHFVVPIEDCYRLVALIRTHWQGFSGGTEVWEEIDGFYDGLARQAKTVKGEPEETSWPR
jgi:hypothetical protein